MQPAENDANECVPEKLIKSSIKHIWHQLTDEEIEAIEEQRDVFFLAVRKKHGLPRAEAEMVLNDFKYKIIKAA